mmetsp:Transcript_214/g.379  ORF Transcript_214/g.379 Transcript_214/m.379 type:complete len:268 (-) Transcript_214:3-806(-)
MEDGGSSDSSNAGDDEASVGGSIATLDLGPGLLEDGGPENRSVIVGLGEDKILRCIAGVLEEELIVDRDEPGLAPDVELHFDDASIVEGVGDKGILYELGELANSSHGRHDVAGPSSSLLGLSPLGHGVLRVEDAGVGVLSGQSSKVVRSRCQIVLKTLGGEPVGEGGSPAEVGVGPLVARGVLRSDGAGRRGLCFEHVDVGHALGAGGLHLGVLHGFGVRDEPEVVDVGPGVLEVGLVDLEGVVGGGRKELGSYRAPNHKFRQHFY